MVRHHVAQRARRIVKAAALFHADRFGDRDLYMIDVIAIPDGLQQTIAKAQNHDVLHGLLTEIMVDAEDLIFPQVLPKYAIELSGRGKIGSEGFFDHHPAPMSWRFTH